MNLNHKRERYPKGRQEQRYDKNQTEVISEI